MSHNCPCAGCKTVIADDKAMCSQHWLHVPAFLQRDIERYWRQTDTGRMPERRIALHNYRVARDAAIKHVDELLAPITA